MTGEEPWCVVIGVLNDQRHISLAGTVPAVGGFGYKVVRGLLLTVKGCRCGQLPCGKEQEVVMSPAITATAYKTSERFSCLPG